MISTPDWQESLAKSEVACLAALEESAFQNIQTEVPDSLATPENCFEALSGVTYAPESVKTIDQRAAKLTSDPQFGRWILLQSALAAISKLAGCQVCSGIKSLWAAEALLLAQPLASSTSIFSPDHVRFREMARIITLQRFPAGQFHWELSGFPRSYIPRTSWRKRPHALAFVLRNLHGFAPLVEIHVNARRRNRLTFTHSEGLLSYYLIARTLAQRPEIKGLFATGWLLCKSTGEVSPQLQWFRNFFEKQGAFLASAGLADEHVGFKTGSETRRKLYDEGSYRPTNAYALWPRREIMAWASNYHPDEVS